jgi:hypothetical protein
VTAHESHEEDPAVKFKQIARRLTGLSSPVFGASWEYRKGDAGHAQDMISYLEDRRVLYNPSEMEVQQHCVESVSQIRDYLTGKLSELDPGSPLAEPVKAMRGSCRKFLDSVGYEGQNPRHALRWRNGMWGEMFGFYLGEMRGVFGFHVAQLAVAYKIDVEEPLATILPPAPE